MDDTGGAPVVIFGGRGEVGTQLALRLASRATVVLATRGANRLTAEHARWALLLPVLFALRRLVPR